MSHRHTKKQGVWTGTMLMMAVLLCSICASGRAVATQEVLPRIEINRGWRIKSQAPQETLEAAALTEAGQGGEEWFDVGAMPATVHDILLRQGKIEAPWGVGGTEKCFCVNTKDWVYVVRFTVPSLGPEARLCFQGIENKVDVYLNGKPLATHNSKLPLVVDVSKHLAQENVLVLHCHADRESDQGKRSDRGSYLGPNPAISSVGVFDKVLLEISSGQRLEEVVVDVALDESLTQGTVTVDATGIGSMDAAEMRLRLLDPDGKARGNTSTKISATGGGFKANAVLKVDRPLLWWPRGYGDQPLYRVEIALVAQGKIQEVVYRTIGFRRITQSEPLHFVVNGAGCIYSTHVTPSLAVR